MYCQTSSLLPHLFPRNVSIAYVFLLLVLPSVFSHPCAPDCRIALWDESVVLSPTPRPPGAVQILRPPRQPMDGVFCRNNALLTNVRLMEAMVRPPDDESAPFVAIRQYKRDGLTPDFPKRYFRPVPGLEIGQGAAVSQNLGTQSIFADGLCVKLPLMTWQRLDSKGNRIKGRLRGRQPQDCVSFTTMSHRALMEITYNSSADFDLIISEPGTTTPFVLSPDNPLSPNGGIHQNPRMDTTPPTCSPRRGGVFREIRRKTIIYPLDSTPPLGRYEIRVMRNLDCENVDVNITLRILLRNAFAVSSRRISKVMGVQQKVVKFVLFNV